MMRGDGVGGFYVSNFTHTPRPKQKTLVNFRMGISQCRGAEFLKHSLEAQPLKLGHVKPKCTKKIWKCEFRTAPKYHSFLLAAVLGVLDGFLPQALLDEFIFCKIRRGIKNKPVLILSSREKVLKLKNCLPLGEATLRQYLGVVRNMLHPHKNKPLCPYSSVTLCISKIHWSSLGNLAAHLKHGAKMFFFLLGGGYWILGMISIPGKSLGHVFWVP